MINKVKSNKKGYLEVDISTPENPKAIMKILPGDLEDLRRAGVTSIWADYRDGRLYARTWLNGKKQYVHRLLVPTKKKVGHVNGNGLDNLRRNLRKIDDYQNAWNRVTPWNNSSGFKGVDFSKGRWRARLGVRGKRISLGCYDTPQEAAVARRRAARRYCGEHANWTEFAA